MTLYNLIKKNGFSCNPKTPTSVTLAGNEITIKYNRGALMVYTRSGAKRLTIRGVVVELPNLLWDAFLEECNDIADGCEEEGYPRYGSNYDLRRESLYREYAEMYPDVFTM